MIVGGIGNNMPRAVRNVDMHLLIKDESQKCGYEACALGFDRHTK